nr:MAG TPA: hypothetical protein [Caudoviricetes sp.]
MFCIDRTCDGRRSHGGDCFLIHWEFRSIGACSDPLMILFMHAVVSLKGKIRRGCAYQFSEQAQDSDSFIIAYQYIYHNPSSQFLVD